MLKITNLNGFGFSNNTNPVQITNISAIDSIIATSASFNNVSIGQPYPNRLLVICIAWNNNANFRTQNSCTVNGNPATRVAQYFTGSGVVTGVTVYTYRLDTGTDADIVSSCSGNAAHTIQVFSVNNANTVQDESGDTGATLNAFLSGDYKNLVIGIAARVYSSGITASWNKLTSTGYTSVGSDNWTLTGVGNKTTSEDEEYIATFSSSNSRSAMMLVSIK